MGLVHLSHTLYFYCSHINTKIYINTCHNAEKQKTFRGNVQQDWLDKNNMLITMYGDNMILFR